MEFSNRTVCENESGALVGKDARVAVIGAGAAGIAAVLGLRAAGMKNITVFEATSKVGGTWNYTSSDVSLGSMYASLRTNLPKETMSFESMPFEASLPSFLGHENVAQYLQCVATREGIMDFIRFNSSVARISPVDPNIFATPWTVQLAVDAPDGRQSDLSVPEYFDAVVVCNGHFSKPSSWRPDGAASWPGRITHSHDYRTPDPFIGKNVVVLGAGPSGTDIALELSQCGVAGVLLSHATGGETSARYGGVVPQCAAVVACRTDGSLVLHDGSIIDDVDELLLCTGYAYSFPFLDANVSGVSVHTDGRVIDGLFMHCIAAAHPTLSLLGQVFKVLPFPLFADQAALIAGVLRGTLPFCISPASMRELCDAERARTAVDKPEKYRHSLDDDQWRYRELIARWTNRKPPPKSVIEMYNHSRAARKSNPVKYRDCAYTRLGDRHGDWIVDST
jgi:Flavin-binding monooxygenase-like